MSTLLVTDDLPNEIIATIEGGVGILTLNRTQALNALTHDMILTITMHLIAWQNNPAIHAVIIRAVAGRAFCAGGDVRKIHQINLPDAVQFFADEYRMNHLIFHYEKPYIALLNGITMGGGAGVAIHGSMRVASENLLFAMPETGIGFFPDIGGSYFLSRLPEQIGVYLGLTGASINLADAATIGLIDYHVASGDFDAVTQQLIAANLTNNPHPTVATIIKQFAKHPPSSALQAHIRQIADIFSRSTIEGMIAGLASENNDWAQQTLQQLQQKSPTSLKVTLAHLRKGRQLHFDNCMRMEFGLAQKFLKNHDFAEGVRAQLIDKDKNAKWQPETLAAVTDTIVASYFNSSDITPLEFLPQH